MSQSRIQDFFKKAVPPKLTPNQNLTIADVGQHFNDVIPASPLSIPKARKSIVISRRRGFTLNSTSPSDNQVALLKKNANLKKHMKTNESNFTFCMKGKSENNGSISISNRKLQADDKIQPGNAKQQPGETMVDLAITRGERKHKYTALRLNQRSSHGKVTRRPKTNIADHEGKPLFCKASQRKKALSNEEEDSKSVMQSKGIKRASSYKRSGLSPFKKKVACSNEKVESVSACNPQLDMAFINENEETESWLDANEDVSLQRMEDMNQAYSVSPITKDTHDNGDCLKISSVSKLQNSFKLSKRSLKKLASFSRKSSFIEGPKNALRSFTDDEEDLSYKGYKNDIVFDYIPSPTDIKAIKASKNKVIEDIHSVSISQPNIVQKQDGVDSNYAEVVKDNIEGCSKVAICCSNVSTCDSSDADAHQNTLNCQGGNGLSDNSQELDHSPVLQQHEPHITETDDGKFDGAMFNTSKDSFNEILSEVNLSHADEACNSVHCHYTKPEVKEVNTDSRESLKTDINLDDSLFGIELDGEKEAVDQIGNWANDQKSVKRNYTVKPQVVLEVTKRGKREGCKFPEKILRLFDEETSQETKCVLREDWERMAVTPGDLVFMTGNSLNSESTIVLDNSSQHYLILFPHTLISGTTVSMGLTCQRQAVLLELFKTDGPNELMVFGTLMHEVFDFVIKEKVNVLYINGFEFHETYVYYVSFHPVFDKKIVEKKVQELLSNINYLNLLYSLGIEVSSIMGKAKEMLARVCSWGRKLLKESPESSDEFIDFKLGNEPAGESDVRLSLSSVADIEENILCPTLGLKGRVDVSAHVKIHRSRRLKDKGLPSQEELEYFLPLEVKTGKMFSKLGSIEHRAQVIIYALMMSEKYDVDIDAGLLYYMRTGHLQGVPASQREKRSLILIRNEIARFLAVENKKHLSSIPGLLQKERVCRRCPAASSCMVFHKSVENGCTKSSGVEDLFEESTGHLTESEMKYFENWFRLVMLEARADAVSNGRGRLWTKTSKERESTGRCVADLHIKKEVEKDKDLWHYMFTKADDASQIPLIDTGILKGERVMISENSCMTFGLCFGYIENVTANELHILCHEKIRPRPSQGQVHYRIDKDESFSSHVIPLRNLMNLIASKEEADKKLRALLIHLAPPQFDLALSDSFVEKMCNREEDNRMQTFIYNGELCSVSDSQLARIRSVYSGLNPDQKIAVSRCLSAKDYLLILGMPGTGKTTTIACIISILVSFQKTVLIASYTHTAVDNILMKIKQMNLDFVRLGQEHKVNEEIRPFIFENATRHIKTVEQLDQFYNRMGIVATTCLGANHTLLTKKRFDYCIVDEASQITQPVCFGAIRCANTFILVGDHYQLPPLVQSVSARNSGMDVSLFKLLSEKHPSAIVSLRYQYRMHKDIMLLSNELIYGHRMQCGTNNRTHDLWKVPRFFEFREQNKVSDSDLFMTHVIDPAQPVIFINSDSIPCPETTTGNQIYNENEASLAALVFKSLIECGAEAEDMGIISPLRRQLKAIDCSLRKVCDGSLVSRVEMNTIDKYQGRDKSCVIVSFVRSNNGGHVGELLKDWRRVNVALTRARHKLIMIGSKKTLVSSPILSQLLVLMESKKWILQADKSVCDQFEKIGINIPR